MTLTAPCDWPAPACPSCGEGTCADTCLDGMTAEQIEALEDWAISDLWAATGKVFGTCEYTVYPCLNTSILCGSCNQAYRQCGCVTVSEVKLPGPVFSVIDVVIDGVSLDPVDYRVDDYQWLVRLDGGTWPTNVDPTDPDGFAVTYLQGVAPPAGAAQAAGLLVCQRSPCNNSGCKLPRNTTSVSRQGVTMTMELTGFGILDVDRWVASANAPTHAGAVHSPDLPNVRRTTWEATVSP